MPTAFLERLRRSPMLCDGAMGTLLYAQGIFINRCYDELNLSQPETIRAIHREYVQAGAEIIETNTFGANSFRSGSPWLRRTGGGSESCRGAPGPRGCQSQQRFCRRIGRSPWYSY